MGIDCFVRGGHRRQREWIRCAVRVPIVARQATIDMCVLEEPAPVTTQLEAHRECQSWRLPFHARLNRGLGGNRSEEGRVGKDGRSMREEAAVDKKRREE